MSTDLRFQSIENLYGEGTLAKLQKSHVGVIGLGGVGSWAAEALVRSGIGKITLIDFDDVCLSNTNRQLASLSSTVGKLKTQVLRERFLDINPYLEIHVIEDRFDLDSCDRILNLNFSCIVDAIDSLGNKVLLLGECWKRNQRIVSVGATGGRTDLSQIMLADVNQTISDQLLAYVRRRLRERHQTPPRDVCMNIPCIFSRQLVEKCEGLSAMDCNTGMGTATYITGTFGFFAAEAVVRGILFDQWTYPFDFKKTPGFHQAPKQLLEF